MKCARHCFLVARAALCVMALVVFCGCSTSHLEAARSNYYMGRLPQAEGSLTEEKAAKEEYALHLMERAMIRQTRGDYLNSAKDFNLAHQFIEEYMMVSLSRGAASLVINDNVGVYYGDPYERTILHAVNARNYIALSEPFEAAVEARLVLRSLQPERKSAKYPEEAYSRYIAGLCFELIGDPSNASIEYRNASNLCGNASINIVNGAVGPKVPSADTVSAGDGGTREMVCLVDYGRIKLGECDGYDRIEGIQYAEIQHNVKALGRTYVVADMQDIAVRTEREKALKDTASTVARIIIKEQISRELDETSPSLGFLARLILYGFLERPDVRRWETLPRFMSVARFRVNSDIKTVDVVFKGLGGREISVIKACPVRSVGGKSIVICRDVTASRALSGADSNR